LISWHHLLKTKFLEGKRNRRADHLIDKLYNYVIPYFIAKHRNQQFGFEGPDLEEQAILEIERRAGLIPRSAVTMVDASLYHVQSQSDPDTLYNVEIEAFHCDCPAFPRLDLCKHLRAVQIHFPEGTGSLTSPFSKWFSTAVSPGRDDDDLHDDDDEPSGIESRDEADMEQAASNALGQPEIEVLILKLQKLAVHARTAPPPFLTESLRDLDDALDTVLLELPLSDNDRLVLPKRRKIAPNQGNDFISTQNAMGMNVKTRPRTERDPYQGKEAPGRKAAPDARQPLASS
jgi:hypothetical protein